MATPWYTSPWTGRTLNRGPAAVVAYLVAGMTSLILATITNRVPWAFLWQTFGAFWIFLGVTLLLTIRCRRSQSGETG